ncbi:MAG: DnaJ domain-containing protein, partial [Candidatus Parcubacteria bacterium]|nr:DnaJ domain-containing protein [Candidatus Parcubacteria bacterium]
MQDYYKTLGIKENASQEEIKRAFHQLAYKHHPDRPGGNEDKFKEINEAYQN